MVLASLASRSTLTGVLVAGCAAAMLAGCTMSSHPTTRPQPWSAPVTVAVAEQPGWPTTAPTPAPPEHAFPTQPVGWVDRDGRTIWIVTWNSSSCPFTATFLERVDSETVAVGFEQRPAEFCTQDMAPRSHRFAVPDGTTALTTARVETVANAFGNAPPQRWIFELPRG
jgi:hypothetical protein